MHRLLIAFACFAGCDAGRSPTHEQPAKQPPAAAVHDAAVTAAVVHDAGAVADASDFDMLFAIETPQVSRDGRFLLVSTEESTGARVAQNLAFELRDRKDRTLQRIVVMAVDEEPDAAARASRVSAVHALLAAHDFVPLVAFTGSREDGQFSGGGLAVSWGSEHMTIAHDGKRVVDRAVPVAWRGSRHYLKSEEMMCENPDLLGGAWGALDAKLVVVQVAYHGNDTCWEPASQLHVVAW